MAIVRWDPWRELAGFERQFDDLFGRMGRPEARASAWAPAVDVHQDGESMVICAEIAGVPPEQVDITVGDDVLTISGKRQDNRSVEDGNWIRRERVSGQFRRSISLPPGVDPDKVKATAKDGVIEIRVPRPTRSEPHRVKLNKGDGKTEVEVASSRDTVQDENGSGSSKSRKSKAAHN